MTEGAFQSELAADELPREVLVDLWDRTVRAHGHLIQVWSEAVTSKHGREVADAIALEGWPLRHAGASDLHLFFDDLRFIVAATELQPEMLTVATRDQASMPNELTVGRRWFRGVTATSRLRGARGPSRRAEPAWEGSPGTVRGWARGKGIEIGFAVLLKAWHASQGMRGAHFDVDAFDRKVRGELDAKALALLWNCAALAYMLVTDRWYTGVRKRFGDEAAQELEKEVWIDRGAAEYDLEIGLRALHVEGNDVEALLKSFQFAPGEVGIIEVELQMEGPDRGTLTHHRCPALDRFEHFDESRLRHCCDICIAAMPISGEMLNRKIECRPLKLPPRRDANDIACKWEYQLRDHS